MPVTTWEFTLDPYEVIEEAEAELEDVRGTPVSLVELFVDGDQWCALLGKDIQVGLVGFGETREEALRALAHEIEEAG